MENEKYVKLSDVQDLLDLLGDRISEAAHKKLAELEQEAVTDAELVDRLWLSTEWERPQESGDYLIKYEVEDCPGRFHYADIHYSKVYDRWNFYDHMTQEEADADEEYRVDYFMEVRI